MKRQRQQGKKWGNRQWKEEGKKKHKWRIDYLEEKSGKDHDITWFKDYDFCIWQIITLEK